MSSKIHFGQLPTLQCLAEYIFDNYLPFKVKQNTSWTIINHAGSIRLYSWHLNTLQFQAEYTLPIYIPFRVKKNALWTTIKHVGSSKIHTGQLYSMQGQAEYSMENILPCRVKQNAHWKIILHAGSSRIYTGQISTMVSGMHHKELSTLVKQKTFWTRIYHSQAVYTLDEYPLLNQITLSTITMVKQNTLWHYPPWQGWIFFRIAENCCLEKFYMLDGSGKDFTILSCAPKAVNLFTATLPPVKAFGP